ncbi:MAG: hypothetical protein Q8O19_01725, partial [Rectinemataceae bacterium]|nr:hypothetical protein [Rectinemataceae bacterium]
MVGRSPFEQYVREYEQWFVDHHWVYQAEIKAMQALLPSTGSGLEIGVGTGRFAGSLGIHMGLEPS